ncbi:hypothetical protein [Halococcus saccharolyticus]|uniref:Uncharacterized protein n=1 Tax=Halococcus saccharolyticus DSM 5350 TaxID=1227455 RepID=M0MNK4_9EURY|nr:hypothetical protein [Halococcus saccharolyticus]EMA46948.1 hypothetical protein C449_02909 [Halococcus saccharolyticus DSM 5350]
MGTFATAVQNRLCDMLAERCVSYKWETERRIAGTPVDIAGRRSAEWVLVELEWRRADPADNTAKLFRHLAEGALDRDNVSDASDTPDADRVAVFQAFTSYYDLTSGGVSAKRENAEFVGRVASGALDRFTYTPIEFELEPPKRGGERPDDWRAVADATARTIASDL